MLAAPAADAGEVLKRVQARKVMRCGVSQGLAGFSIQDASGRWTGMDADFCRAVAAAALGSADGVRFVALSAQARFVALQTDQIDLLARNTSWTLSREAVIGVQFTGTLYHDGQAFMVPRKAGTRDLAGLNGAQICVGKGTTSEASLADHFAARKWKYTPVVLESLNELAQAFFSGKCRAYTADRSQLAAVRATAPKGAGEYVILPQQISKEPLGAVVKRGDDEWFTLVRWVLFGLLEAEERGYTQANAREILAGPDPDTRRAVSTAAGFGRALGVGPDWALHVLEAVGNYAEMYDRNLGANSPLKLERGLNRLWNQGGLMYSPPFR